MRRLVTLSLALGLLLAMASPAVADPKGDLTSAFSTEVNQYRNMGDPGFALERPEGFVSPLVDDLSTPRQVCDEQVVGTWLSWSEATREEIENLEVSIEIWLDDEMLDTKKTPIKQRKLRNPLPDQDWVFVFTEGVPVLGTLDEGTHFLTYLFVAPWGSLPVPLELDVSSAYC